MGENGSCENEEAVFGGGAGAGAGLPAFAQPRGGLAATNVCRIRRRHKSRHALADFHRREPSPFAITVACDWEPVCHLATAATLLRGNRNEPKLMQGGGISIAPAGLIGATHRAVPRSARGLSVPARLGRVQFFVPPGDVSVAPLIARS